MVGEAHSDESHSELTLFANKISVPIGDIADLGTAVNTGKPYTLEKYITINGTRYIPSEAQAIIAWRSSKKHLCLSWNFRTCSFWTRDETHLKETHRLSQKWEHKPEL